MRSLIRALGLKLNLRVCFSSFLVYLLLYPIAHIHLCIWLYAVLVYAGADQSVDESIYISLTSSLPCRNE